MDNNLKYLEIVKLAHRERLTDRYSETQIISLEHRSQPIALVGFVEILSRWNPAREIGATLPQNFARYFNRSTHQSILTRFEDALKNINTAITLANQKMDSPISAAIALHVGNEVYFSSVGKAKITLIRNKKATTVSASGKDDDVTEFGTVTSGELSATDKMCYGNDEFLTICKQLSDNIVEITKQFKSIVSAGGTVETGAIVGLSPDNNGRIETIYVNDRSSSINVPKINFSKFITSLVPVLEKIKKLFTDTSTRIKTAIDSRRIKKANTAKPTTVITESEDLPDSTFPPKRQRLNAKIKLPRLSATGITGLVILVALAGATGWAVNKAVKAHQQKVAPPVAEVPALIADIQTASVSNIPAVVANELTQDRYKYLSNDQITTLNTLVAQAGIIVIQPPAPLFSLPTTVAFVATTPKNDLTYAIDQTGQLYSWDGKTLTTIKQTTTISTPISMTVLARNKVVVSDAQANMYLFDGSDKQPIKMTQPTGWTTGNRFVQSYNGNLYVLTINDGIVHKIPGFGSDIANDTTLVRIAADTTDHLLSFLINGDINTLTIKTGLVDHPKTGNPTTLVSADKLLANSTAAFGSNNIAVVAGNLIGYYTPQGQYQSGKALISSDKIIHIIGNGTAGMLVVIGSNIYAISN